jgi:hypothetical protein
MANDEGDSSVAFEVGVFAPTAVIAQLPSVISPKDDDGVLCGTRFLESFQEHAHIAIDVTDAGVMLVKELLVELRRKLSR